MKTVQFKTNIKCSACVAKVTPALNEVAGEDNWKVDLQTQGKVLTVSTDKSNEEEIKKALENVGYRAEELS